MAQIISDLRLRLSEMFPSTPQFSVGDIPSQAGRVCLVTGSNQGIGFETVLQLAKAGAAKVILCSRDAKKGQEAVEKAKRESGSDSIEFLQLDLADLKAVKKAATEVRHREKRLDVLVCNAGVMVPPVGSKTADGLELQFGTNVVGHVAFIEHLKPLLLDTARASPKAATRIVIVSSSGHELAPFGGPDFDDLELKKHWGRIAFQKRWMAYGNSKLGNVIMAKELARRHENEGLLVVSLNPGNIYSQLHRHFVPDWMPHLAQKVGGILTPQQGALTQIYCATSKDLTMKDSGGYFIPLARRGHAYRKEAYDEDMARRLFDFSLAQMKKAGASA